MDKKNTAPTSNANPNDATARLRFEAVVVTEGTVGGKPARIALYGTRYAACEVESGGAWIVHQDVGFGGIRGVGQLKQYLDDAAVEPAPVVALVAEPVEVVAEPAAEVVPAAVEPEPVVEAVAAPAEPILTTLDEVRAAFDAETRGACRASVLRALRVRAGEIALGLPAGGKAEKVHAPRGARPWIDAVAAKFEAGETTLSAADGEAIGLPASAFKFSGGWAPSGNLGAALAARGLRGRLRGGSIVVERVEG